MIKAGAAVLFKVKPGASRQDVQSAISPYRASKAALLIVPEVAGAEAMFQRLGSQPPRAENRIGDTPAGPDMILLKSEPAQQLWSMQDGTALKLHAEVTPWTISHTWNVLAKIEGAKQKAQSSCSALISITWACATARCIPARMTTRPARSR